MDPQSDRSPGLGLPPPSIEQGGPVFDPSNIHTMQHHKPELAPISPEIPPVALPPAFPVVATSSVPASASLAVATLPSDPAPPTDASPATDDNSDALDEEWVSKAKAIVEQTKSDPYAESRELSKVKADYLKIRYNKQLKVAEDQP